MKASGEQWPRTAHGTNNEVAQSVMCEFGYRLQNQSNKSIESQICSCCMAMLKCRDASCGAPGVLARGAAPGTRVCTRAVAERVPDLDPIIECQAMRSFA